MAKKTIKMNVDLANKTNKLNNEKAKQKFTKGQIKNTASSEPKGEVIDENEPCDLKFIQYLGFTIKNGAWIKEGYGEIKFIDGSWYYFKNLKEVKHLEIKKDLITIYMNAEKTAILTVSLETIEGYKSDSKHKISADQYKQIIEILEPKPVNQIKKG